MSVSGNERLHSLDAVRAGALLLGIVLHASMSFWPGDIPSWFIVDPQKSYFAFATFTVIHIFRMALFFFLAGFFGRMMFHRLGAGRFIRNRLQRIALPLVLFWPVSMGLILAAIVWSAAKVYGWPLPPEVAEGPPTPDVPFYFPLTHLWFLYVLLWLYAGMILLRLPVALVDRGSHFRGMVDRVVRWLVEYHSLYFILAIPVVIALWNHPGYNPPAGVPTPDQSLLVNTPALVTFGLAFGFGWVMQRSMDLLQIWKRSWLWNLAGAVILSGICLYMAGPVPSLVPPELGPKWLFFAFCYAVAMWTWIAALTGLAMQFLHGENKAVRYIADASYWMYILHLPLVMALQVVVMDWDWPALAKLAFILAVTTFILLATYHVLVRYTFVGWILNGKIRKWSKSKKAPEMVQET